MHARKIRIYFGHKLTKASPVFLQKMADLKEFLKSRLTECEFLEFLGVKDGTASDVYQKDIKENVATCDLFIVFLDEESTGAGFEYAAALYGYGKPILVLATEGEYVTRLGLGAEAHHCEQIIVCRVVSDIDVVIAIRACIVRFHLDTTNPTVFPGRYVKQPGAVTQTNPPYQATDKSIDTLAPGGSIQQGYEASRSQS